MSKQSNPNPEMPPCPPRIVISQDELTAYTDIDPDPDFDIEEAIARVMSRLAEGGICFGIDESTVRKTLVKARASKQRLSRVQVAKGILAVAPSEAGIEFQFRVAGEDPSEIDPAQYKLLESQGLLVLEFVEASDSNLR